MNATIKYFKYEFLGGQCGHAWAYSQVGAETIDSINDARQDGKVGQFVDVLSIYEVDAPEDGTPSETDWN